MKRRILTRRQRPYVSADGDDSDEDAKYPYCNGKFSQDGKEDRWIMFCVHVVS
jgi:hypothetical protein